MDSVARQYDLFQTSLESLAKERKYLNYGWTERGTGRRKSYEERQERLCLEVFRAAAIGPADRVVDVGFGSGEQDFLLARERGFARLDGFNIAARQVAWANQRAAREGLAERMEFHHGEAEELAGLGPGSADKLMAIECAFYFDRGRFYRRAAEVLRPGGLLVKADITLSDRLAFLSRRDEDYARLGTRSANRALWEPWFETRELRSINRYTRPGAQMTVRKILRIAPFSGFSPAERREWFKMAWYTQLVVLGLATRLLHYDLVVLERR